MRRGIKGRTARVLAVIALALVMGAATCQAGTKGLLVFHLDFNTLQFREETISNLLERAAADGYNAILWEVENKVRWECCPEVAAHDAYAKEDFRRLLDRARRLGLEPIPLMQTFGHAEYVLGCERYRSMRECPERKNCYCVSSPDVRRFQKRLLLEYIELFGPDVKRFHLGGDEAYGYGSCATCRAREPLALYIEHLDAISEELTARQIRPIVWHDMLQHFDKSCASFALLPKRYGIWYWEYYVRRYQTWSKQAEETLCREAVAGREIVFCAASQCYRDDPFLVKYGLHRANIAEAADVCRRCGLSGLCLTSWSVHTGSKTLQMPLMDFAAKEYRTHDPAAHWQAVVRANFGDASPDALDALTGWDDDLGNIDGRYGKYKDAAIPAAGLVESVACSPEKRGDYARRANLVLDRVEGALDELRKVPSGKRTDLLRLALEAGELKRDFHRAQLVRLETGRPVGVSVDRARDFYSREQSESTVERSLRRVYDPLKR